MNKVTQRPRTGKTLVKQPTLAEKGEQEIAKMKKLKPKFDKFSYPEKLNFFEENNLQPEFYQYYFFEEGEHRNKPENHLSIFPQTENEYTTYFNYCFSVFKKQRPLQYDIEAMKENYNKTIEGNPQSIYYTQTELDKYKNTHNYHYGDNSFYLGRDRKRSFEKHESNAYIKGFNSVALKQKIDFDYHDFTYMNNLLLFDGIIATDFIDFLEENLRSLEEEKKNPKKDSSEIDNEILEVRTKLILLNKLGVVKHLQGFEPFTNATELCKFLTEIIETKEENKKKTFEAIRTDLRYIDLPQKKNRKSPNTSTALRKVNSILTKHGLPIITE